MKMSVTYFRSDFLLALTYHKFCEVGPLPCKSVS